MPRHADGGRGALHHARIPQPLLRHAHGLPRQLAGPRPAGAPLHGALHPHGPRRAGSCERTSIRVGKCRAPPRMAVVHRGLRPDASHAAPFPTQLFASPHGALTTSETDIFMGQARHLVIPRAPRASGHATGPARTPPSSRRNSTPRSAAASAPSGADPPRPRRPPPASRAGGHPPPGGASREALRWRDGRRPRVARVHQPDAAGGRPPERPADAPAGAGGRRGPHGVRRPLPHRRRKELLRASRTAVGRLA